MKLDKLRQPENLIYIGGWALIIIIYIVDLLRTHGDNNETWVNAASIFHMINRLLPFVVLFSLNNALLIPHLILREKYLQYFIMVSVLILLIWSSQFYLFIHETSRFNGLGHPFPHGAAPKPILPLPVFLDLICDLLVIGFNLAIALIFQRINDTLEYERKMKTDAKNQLAYLRAQLNPHFYMNMLNNIHGMIEINPEKAQEMLINMSQLMRYMLYESSLSWIPLDKELMFIRNYLKIMCERYPEDKVKITSEFPSNEISSKLFVPPLVFLVFIENAFKHGISYREKSFVSIKIEVYGNNIMFGCINSISTGAEQHNNNPGIGLKNIEQRMNLIYGDKCHVEIKSTNNLYIVNVSLPAYEDKDINN